MKTICENCAYPYPCTAGRGSKECIERRKLSNPNGIIDGLIGTKRRLARKKAEKRTVTGMAETDRILVSKIRDAVDAINAQLEDNFIDFGPHDELEIRILRNALAVWEERVLEPREKMRR